MIFARKDLIDIIGIRKLFNQAKILGNQANIQNLLLQFIIDHTKIKFKKLILV